MKMVRSMFPNPVHEYKRARGTMQAVSRMHRSTRPDRLTILGGTHRIMRNERRNDTVISYYDSRDTEE